MQEYLKIDFREKDIISEVNKRNLEYFNKTNLIICNLDIGDFEIGNDKYKIIIERKTLSDLLSSIKDGRYREQKIRLLSQRSTECKICYLLEDINIPPIHKNTNDIINGTIISLLLRDEIPIFKTTGIPQTVDIISRLFCRFKKDALIFFKRNSNKQTNINTDPNVNVLSKNPVKEFNDTNHSTENSVKEINFNYLDKVKVCKKKNITPNTWSCLALKNIPGVSTKIANTILNEYKSVSNLINTYNQIENIDEKDNLLKNIKIIGCERKVGKSVSKKVHDYLTV